MTHTNRVNPDADDVQRSIGETLRGHWRLFLIQGAIMIILGVLAIATPAVATIAVGIFVGWLFLISGIFGLMAAFSAQDVPAFLWTVVTALLSVIVGALLIWQPVAGALSLTVALTAFFIVEGIFQAGESLVYRNELPGSWGWMFASGLADLLLAAIVILGWPGSAVWTLGLLVGINLVTSGWAVVMVALAARGDGRASAAAVRG